MSGLKAGDLNRRVEWQRAADLADGSGGFTRSWSPVKKLWAKAMPIGGKEALIAGTLQAVQNWRVEIRWRRDAPTTHDRFVLNGRPLNIQSIEDVTGARISLVALCTTEAPQ